MHLDEAQRREAMANVAGLLEPGGVLAMSLRHGPVPPGRRMLQVGGHETIDLAAECGLSPVINVTRDSIQPINLAAGVTWTHLAFSRPKIHRSCLAAPLRSGIPQWHTRTRHFSRPVWIILGFLRQERRRV